MCSNKTLFTKAGGRLDLAHREYNPCSKSITMIPFIEVVKFNSLNSWRRKLNFKDIICPRSLSRWLAGLKSEPRAHDSKCNALSTVTKEKIKERENVLLVMMPNCSAGPGTISCKFLVSWAQYKICLSFWAHRANKFSLEEKAELTMARDPWNTPMLN